MEAAALQKEPLQTLLLQFPEVGHDKWSEKVVGVSGSSQSEGRADIHLYRLTK